MIETLILSFFISVIGGIIGCNLYFKNLSPRIKMEKGFITYMQTNNTEYVTIKDKFGNEIADIGIARNKNGLNYFKYAGL